MVMKPSHTAAVGTCHVGDAPYRDSTTVCSNCGVDERLPLHNLRHRATFRRLCTTCVLRLHPQSFCPTCFQVYPPPPPNGALLTCFKCYSSTHSHCVASPPIPYICPLCVSPSTQIFKLKTSKEANVEGLGGECRVMDRDAAKKLLAAAKIVSASMNKAAMAAKAEAEKKAKEAAFTRKKAKEALQYLAHLVMNEKLRKKEAVNSNVFVGSKANHVIMEENMKTSGVRADDHGVDAGMMVNLSDVNPGTDEGLFVDWSDVSDIDQMLFSDED